MCCVQLGASRTPWHTFSNLSGVCSSLKSMVLFKRVYGFGERGSNGRDRQFEEHPSYLSTAGAFSTPKFLLCPLPFISLLSSTSPPCVPPGAPSPVLKAQWVVEWGWEVGERHVFVENSNKIFHGIYNLP